MNRFHRHNMLNVNFFILVLICTTIAGQFLPLPESCENQRPSLQVLKQGDECMKNTAKLVGIDTIALKAECTDSCNAAEQQKNVKPDSNGITRPMKSCFLAAVGSSIRYCVLTKMNIELVAVTEKVNRTSINALVRKAKSCGKEAIKCAKAALGDQVNENRDEMKKIFTQKKIDCYDHEKPPKSEGCKTEMLLIQQGLVNGTCDLFSQLAAIGRTCNFPEKSMLTVPYCVQKESNPIKIHFVFTAFILLQKIMLNIGRIKGMSMSVDSLVTASKEGISNGASNLDTQMADNTLGG